MAVLWHTAQFASLLRLSSSSCLTLLLFALGDFISTYLTSHCIAQSCTLFNHCFDCYLVTPCCAAFQIRCVHHHLSVLFACSYALAICDLLHLAEALPANNVPICLQEEQRELAKTIRVSGSILLSTVSNFLDFFKMEAGKQLDVVRTEITTKVMPSPLPPSDIPFQCFCPKSSTNTYLMMLV